MLDSELLYRVTPFRLDSLLLGGLIALLWHGSHRRQILNAGRAAAALTAAAAIIYLALTIHPHARPAWTAAYIYPAWRLTWGLTFVNVLAASVILTCLHGKNWLNRILSLRPLRWLGRISYGAYIYHDILHAPVSQLTHILGRHWTFIPPHEQKITLLLALIVTLVLAWLSFHFFESPFLNLKERWTLRPSRAQTSA